MVWDGMLSEEQDIAKKRVICPSSNSLELDWTEKERVVSYKSHQEGRMQPGNGDLIDFGSPNLREVRNPIALKRCGLLEKGIPEG